MTSDNVLVLKEKLGTSFFTGSICNFPVFYVILQIDPPKNTKKFLNLSVFNFGLGMKVLKLSSFWSCFGKISQKEGNIMFIYRRQTQIKIQNTQTVEDQLF